MTAVEVLVASLLSALLMVAIMGTMRGLKAHERALDLRDPTASWQRSLAHVLQQDLNNARTIKVMPQFLELQGVAGIGSDHSEQAWLPIVIRYEIRQTDRESWLIRTERHEATAELVCQGVTSLRASLGAGSGETTNTLGAGSEQPVADGLTIEFLQVQGMPIFQYVFRQM
jgi:hypothetical protein